MVTTSLSCKTLAIPSDQSTQVGTRWSSTREGNRTRWWWQFYGLLSVGDMEKLAIIEQEEFLKQKNLMARFPSWSCHQLQKKWVSKYSLTMPNLTQFKSFQRQSWHPVARLTLTKINWKNTQPNATKKPIKQSIPNIESYPGSVAYYDTWRGTEAGIFYSSQAQMGQSHNEKCFMNWSWHQVTTKDWYMNIVNIVHNWNHARQCNVHVSQNMFLIKVNLVDQLCWQKL